jgi:hypothetical protein
MDSLLMRIFNVKLKNKNNLQNNETAKIDFLSNIHCIDIFHMDIYFSKDK